MKVKSLSRVRLLAKESDTTKQLIHTHVRNTAVNKVGISGIMGGGRVQIFLAVFVQTSSVSKQYLLILALTDTYSHYVRFFYISVGEQKYIIG